MSRLTDIATWAARHRRLLGAIQLVLLAAFFISLGWALRGTVHSAAHDLDNANLVLFALGCAALGIVGVVVRMAGDDVQIGAAQSHRLDAHDDLVRRRRLHRHVTDLDPPDVDEHGGTHGRPGGRGRRHRRSATSGARTTPTQAEPPGYANSARLSARMVML